MEVICSKCSYRWNYKGKSEWYATCPSCKTIVNLKRDQSVVVDIDFYVWQTLPPKIKDYCGVDGKIEGVIGVRTILVPGKGVRYQLDELGSTPEEICEYMHKLAREEGRDLNEVMKRAFGDIEDE